MKAVLLFVLTAMILNCSSYPKHIPSSTMVRYERIVELEKTKADLSKKLGEAEHAISYHDKRIIASQMKLADARAEIVPYDEERYRAKPQIDRTRDLLDAIGHHIKLRVIIEELTEALKDPEKEFTASVLLHYARMLNRFISYAGRQLQLRELTIILQDRIAFSTQEIGKQRGQLAKLRKEHLAITSELTTLWLFVKKNE